MTALITIDSLREHVETDINNLALQRILDAVDDEIVASVGPHASTGDVTELIMGGDVGLFLARPYTTITSISEVFGTAAAVTLSTDDYRSWFGNRTLQRLTDGTNPQSRWGDRVTVIYEPLTDDNMRILSTIELVQLSLQYSGLQSEQAGDYRSTAKDHAKERAGIINRLNRRRLIGA